MSNDSVFLVGRRVKIVINEPYEWAYGDLVGSIVNAEAEKLLVKLSITIQGSKLTSDLLEIKPRYLGVTFNTSAHKRKIEVNGAIVVGSSDAFDFVLIGTITLSR